MTCYFRQNLTCYSRNSLFIVALIDAGPRLTTHVMTCTPALTATIASVVLNEQLKFCWFTRHASKYGRHGNSYSY